MPEHMKKPHTDKKIMQITLTGPAVNRDKAVQGMKKFGFTDTSDSVPWREAFPDYDETNKAGQHLKGGRYKEDLTQRELSEKSGIPQRHISEMENGKRPVGKNNAKKFSRILKIDYRMFL